MYFDITDNLAYEIWALLIIQSPFINGSQIVRHTIDGKTLDFKHFKKDESPDWQSKELDMGIEVTIAISEQKIVDMKTFKLAIRDARSLTEVNEYLQQLDKRGVFSAEVSQQGPFYMMDHYHADNIGMLKKCIEKKIKLSAKYNKFMDNWLFIFFVGYLQKDKIASAIRDIKGHDSFNRYIIKSLGNSDGVYYIDAPYREVANINHFDMSNEIIVDEVEKIRTTL